jgi:hypothetical protein
MPLVNTAACGLRLYVFGKGKMIHNPDVLNYLRERLKKPHMGNLMSQSVESLTLQSRRRFALWYSSTIEH